MGPGVSELKKILYVEDQKDIQVIAEYALTQISHYNLKLCSSGDEALTVIEAYNPDFIVLDVMMPGIDGPETLTQIRKMDAFKNTPVIFMTAKVLPNEIADLIAYGALDVISKPFDPVTLGASIQTIWDNL